MGTLNTGKRFRLEVRLAQLCILKGLPADAWTYLLLAEFGRVGRA